MWTDTELAELDRVSQWVLRVMAALDGLTLHELRAIVARKAGVEERVVGRTIGTLLDQGRVKLNEDMEPYLP